MARSGAGPVTAADVDGDEVGRGPERNETERVGESAVLLAAGRIRRDPEGALVGSDSQIEGASGPPLDGFGADEGGGGGKLPHD